HNADWTYSLAFPPGHEWHAVKAGESYRRVHEWIRRAFAKLNVATDLAPTPTSGMGQCFVGHEKSDLLWNGMKIAGAAQRRNKLGLLIQGSVQFRRVEISITRADWQKAMEEVGRVELEIEWSDFEPPAAMRERAESLAGQKYSQPE